MKMTEPSTTALKIVLERLEQMLDQFGAAVAHLKEIVDSNEGLNRDPKLKRDNGRLTEAGIAAVEAAFGGGASVMEVSRLFEITPAAASNRRKIWVSTQQADIGEFDMSMNPKLVSDEGALRRYMINAKRLHRDDLFWTAFERLCDLQTSEHADPVVTDFWRAIAALEELLFLEHGKHLKAMRTRKKVKEHGEEKCLVDWVLAKQETKGFRMLVEAGLSHLTGEAIVVKHAERFPEHVVSAARIRLDTHSEGFTNH